MSVLSDSIAAPHKLAGLRDASLSLAFEALDAAGDGTLIVRVHEDCSVIEYASRAFGSFTGHAADDLQGRRPDFIRSLDGRWSLAEILERRCLADGARAEVRGLRTDGTAFRAQLQLRLLPSDAECCVLTFTALPAAQAIELAALQLPMPVVVLETDLRIRWVNRAFEQAAGLPATAFLGRTWYELVPEADHRRALHEEIVAGRRELLVIPVLPITLANQSTRYFTAHFRPLFDADGAVDGVVAFGVEITAQLEAEAARRRSEERLRTVTDHMPDGLAILGVDGHVIWQSSSSLGYQPEARIGSSVFEHVHPDDLEAARSRFVDLVTDVHNDRVHDLELRLRHADGSWRWIHMTGSNLLAHPAVRGLVLSSRDVTAQRQAAAALRDSEERYRAIAEMTPGFIFEAELRNGHPVMIWAGPGLERIHECTLEEYLERNLESRVHPDDIALSDQHCLALQRGEQVTGEFRVFMRDRRMKWIRAQVRPLGPADENGVIRLIGAVEDVTEPHRIARLRAETESVARVGSWELDYQTRRLYWSPETYRIVETTPALYTPTYETIFALCAPESLPRMQEFFERALQGGEPWDADLEIITLRSRRIWVRTSGRVEFANGQPIRFYGAFQDIDVLKRNEIELRQQRRWLRLALDAAKLVAWRWIAETNELVVEYRGLGMPMIEPRTTGANKAIDYLHEDYRGLANQMTETAMNSGVPMDAEMRVIDSRGLERWVATRAARYHDSSGRVVGLIGATQDVTDKRVAENSLRTQAHVLLTMLEGVAVVDPQGRIKLTNPAFDLMFDHPGGTLLGTQLRELFEDAESQVARPRTVGVASVERSFEFLGRRRTGTTFMAAAVVSRVTINDDTCEVYVVQDITERKRLERELIEISNREQERIGSDLHDGLGQELTGIALMLRGLSSRMQRGATPAAADVEEILGLVNQTIESARSLARGLSPVSVERGGLVYALRALATRASDLYGADVRFRSRGSTELGIDATTGTHLYRIAQEAVTNAVRHGHANRIVIQLHFLARRLRLTVVDDGSGLPPDAVNSGGTGLKIMKYRAQMIGGEFRIEPAPQQGTQVVCIVQGRTRP